MSFSYFTYLIYDLMLPIFGISFIAVPVVKMVMRVIGQIRRGEAVEFGGFQVVIMFIALLILAGILINILFQGGIHLIYERSGDALTVEGTIESIEANGILDGTQYNYEGERSNGYDITVNGVTFTSMAKGSLEVGDEVTVTYMPNSGFALTIEELTP